MRSPPTTMQVHPEAPTVTEQQSETPPEKSPLFTAVGAISGFVSLNAKTEKPQIQIGSKIYLLGYPQSHQDAFQALKLEIKKGGKELNLIVYPRFTHFPGKDKVPHVSFQVVGFFAGSNPEWPTFEFKLAGLWQFIPVCRQPCISVFKNFTEEATATARNSLGNFLRFIDSLKFFKELFESSFDSFSISIK